MLPDRILQTWDGWTAAIPKVCCLLEVELQQLSFVKKKLLKITNYPSLAVYRTIPKPQRMPLVLTLTKTTHVTQYTSSCFFFSLHSSIFFSLSVFCLIWSTFISVCFYTCQSVFISACLSNQRQTRLRIGSNRWETWSISMHEIKKIAIQQHDTTFEVWNTVIHW